MAIGRPPAKRVTERLRILAPNKPLAMRILCFLAAILGLTLSGCNEDTDNRTDEEKILDYLAENNLDAERDNSGLYYIIEESGGSARPSINNNVEVRYKGTLLNGDVFDQTQGDNTVTFPLSNLIPAWQIGIPLIGRNGSIVLFCPSNLGYGNRAVGSIPAGSVLIFEIDLVDFN